MGKVVVVARLPGPTREVLAPHEVVLPPEGEDTLSTERLWGALGDAEGLLSILSLRVDEALLARAPRLKVVANYAVGFDNIDLAATARRGIVVTHTPNVLTAATADLAMALLLAAARRLPEGAAMIQQGEWHGWAPEQLPALDLEGAQLGIVGLGRIGQAMAARARGFGLRLVYSQPRRLGADQESALGVRWLPLDELVATSDIVSLHCPLVPATRHLMNAERLGRMKRGAVLVNTARGAVVDEAALVQALRDGHLGGVGLDVFEDEPRVHPGLLAFPRAVLMPHLGSATVGTRRRMVEIAAQSIVDVLAGRRPAHVVGGR